MILLPIFQKSTNRAYQKVNEVDRDLVAYLKAASPRPRGRQKRLFTAWDAPETGPRSVLYRELH